jgi:hypothetical protein
LSFALRAIPLLFTWLGLVPQGSSGNGPLKSSRKRNLMRTEPNWWTLGIGDQHNPPVVSHNLPNQADSVSPPPPSPANQPGSSVNKIWRFRVGRDNRLIGACNHGDRPMRAARPGSVEPPRLGGDATEGVTGLLQRRTRSTNMIQFGSEWCLVHIA